MSDKKAKKQTINGSPQDSEKRPRNKSVPQSKQTEKKSVSQKIEEEISNNNHYTKFSDKIFKEDLYLPKFIKEVESDPLYFKCLKCIDCKSKGPKSSPCKWVQCAYKF